MYKRFGSSNGAGGTVSARLVSWKQWKGVRKCAIVLFLLTKKCASEMNLSNCQIDLNQSGYVDRFFDHLQAADICSISIQLKKNIISGLL